MLIVQWSVVVLLVAVSALYSLWRLLSLRQRLWLLEQLLPLAGWAQVGWPARLRSSLQRQALQGCGGCSANADAAPTRKSGAPRR
ncbi:MAG TPA: hypothetical protein VMC02_15810 [Steroidobacteraceae bacterium]|nr:hypothetical protein [Steroidobacteraceae bacterium]